jgi:hypothetical protein
LTITPRSPSFAGRVVLHQRCRGLGHVEAADQVDHDRRLERLQRHRPFLAEHAAGAEDAGAVDRRVQATHSIGGLLQRRRDVFLAGDIGAVIAGLRAEFGDAAAPFSSLMSTRATLAPRAASRVATANPSPETPPVTTALT